MKSFTLVSS